MLNSSVPQHFAHSDRTARSKPQRSGRPSARLRKIFARAKIFVRKSSIIVGNDTLRHLRATDPKKLRTAADVTTYALRAFRRTTTFKPE
jgi:hypothetical protein